MRCVPSCEEMSQPGQTRSQGAGLTKALLVGLLTYLPGFRTIARRRGGGGTASPRYCYSVWLRHLVMAAEAGLPTSLSTVAELGPGDSVGVGLAALLSGADRYWALDLVSYASPERNLAIFDGLVDLFNQRAPIPDEVEFAEIQPTLNVYHFPANTLTEERLTLALAPARQRRLRTAVRALGVESGDGPLSYMVSWQDAASLRPSSVDALFSQAVLEHVDDLPATYRAMHAWLKPGGYMSHQIDFRSHGMTKVWNGHWALSDGLWKLMRGR